MGLKGYCSQCQTLVDMADLQTVRLANLQYVQQGHCPSDGSLIFKAIPDSEMFVVPPGNYFPKTIYVGEDTPAKLIKDRNGQQIVTGEIVLSTKAQKLDIKTLAQIKEEPNEGKNDVGAVDQSSVVDTVEG